MSDNYTYPAILDYSEKGYITVIFPDFPQAVTCVEEGEDYVTEAQDCLTLAIADLEDEGREVPEGTTDREIALEEGQKLIYINVWMPYHRSRIKEVYVKKTLTIPSWLDILAKNNNINFSATLVEALKDKLKLR